MTDEKKPMNIRFAPGCFDNFEGTQEELDELMQQIQNMFDSGEAQVKAIPLSDLIDELSEEELEQIMAEVADEVGVEELDGDFFAKVTNTRTLH